MLWRVDLHLHTTVSDGIMSPNELCALLRLLDLKAVVTDHDRAGGQAALLSLCPDRTIRGVYAMEKTECAHMVWRGRKYKVHFNVFCPRFFQASEVPCSLEDAYEWAERNGCLIQWNHPLFWPHQVPWLNLREWLLHGVQHSHMVELSNGNHTFLQDWLAYYALGGKAFKPGRYAEALRRFEPMGRAATSNSDMHIPSSLGLNYNFMPPADSFDEFASIVLRREIKPGEARRAPICTKAVELKKWSGELPRKAASLLKPLWKACGVNEQVVAWWRVRDGELSYLTEERKERPALE